MRKSIYGKLFFGFICTIIVSFIITGIFIVRANNQNTNRLTVDELEDSSDHIADLVKRVSEKDIQSILEDYSDTSNMSFKLLSSEKTYISNQYGKQNGFSNKELKKLLKHPGSSASKSSGANVTYAKSYTINDKIYVVAVQKDTTSTQKVFLTSYVISGLILFVMGSVIFLILSDFIVKPISDLTKATNELIKGNYKVRVSYAGDDEIARLNNAFNQMAISLDKQEATRQQFISDVSHEFQTPLTAISGFANILKTENLPDDQRKKYADIILSNAKRLSTLSKNMLQLTLLEGEEVKLDISVYSLIAQLNRVIETQDYSALTKDIEIEFIKPRGDILVEADEARMEQVWTNLINNAIKYTKEHGVITIEVKKSGGFVDVLVQDTGIGMSKETISHIFERFYRDDKSRAIEGNGLGLSIVQRIITLHHFKMDVTSEEDVGSTFSVRMPIYSKKSASRFNVRKEEK